MRSRRSKFRSVRSCERSRRTSNAEFDQLACSFEPLVEFFHALLGVKLALCNLGKIHPDFGDLLIRLGSPFGRFR